MSHFLPPMGKQPLAVAGALWILALLVSPSQASGSQDPPGPITTKPVLLGVDGARHLLARVAFGGSPEQIVEFAALERQVAVERILGAGDSASGANSKGVDGAATAPDHGFSHQLPDWTRQPAPAAPGRRATQEERQKYRQLLRRRGQSLKAWWLGELLATDDPLRERMTLFWHNHFTSGLRKVRSPYLMLAQNQLLRRHSTGNFRQLVHAICRDPAMMVYLDTVNSRKDSPNENFARELLELFTLGEGHYSEKDVQQAARAFTGWRLNRQTGKARVVPRRQDRGEKTFLGSTGLFDGDDIVRIVLTRKQVADSLVNKLWLEFVSPAPDADQCARLATLLRDSDYEMKPVLRQLFLGEAFWAESNRGLLVKSPVDLLIGTIRTFDLPVWSLANLATLSRQLGQDLFDPPSVKGWPGGARWINSSTLLLRQSFLERSLQGEGRRRGPKQDSDRNPENDFLVLWLERIGGGDPDAGLRVAARMLGTEAQDSSPPQEDDRTAAEHLWQMVLSPTFQVK